MSNTATAGTVSQQRRALDQANRVRLARAALKRRVAAEPTAAAEVITECPWEAASMSISELLRSQRRWGSARCRRLLVSLELPENKQIGSLTERQRRVLVAVLGAGGAGGARAESAPAEATSPGEAAPPGSAAGAHTPAR